MQISQPRISQHLKVLKELRLLTERKEAQRTFYKFKVALLEKHLNGLLAFSMPI